jgi:predicted transcriptional regulator
MTRPALGDQELRVFRYVADRAPVSVSEVARDFGERLGLARTTILTVMDRLRRKGYLKRRKLDGAYRYSPAIPKRDVVRSLVRDFAERVLAGSPQPFVAYLAEDAELSDAEVDQLGELVRGLEKRRKRGRR